jgi:hypothetical protein
VDVGESAENLAVTVSNHDCADDYAQNQQSQWLQTIEIAQGFSSGERR